MDGYTNAQKERMAEEELRKSVDDLSPDKLPTANIMVAGATGAGKSTLLNAVFGDELAATGTGRPVTSHIKEYSDENIPIHIWDTVGLEMDSKKTKESIESIKDTIAKKADSEDQFDRIHAIWYCIYGDRYQESELDFIESLHSIGVPFIIVLTQCIRAEEDVNAFEAAIREMNKKRGMNDIEIVQTLARDYKLCGGSTIKSFGLDTLVDTTLNKLPDFIKDGFIAAQRVNKEEKRRLCETTIYKYIKMAKEGFWDKVPLVNVYKANKKIMNMFAEIGTAYNTVLSEESVEKIRSKCNITFENWFFGLVSPIDMGYGKKISALLEKKKEEGFDVEYDSFTTAEKAARFIAFYGYIFISSIEELWERLTEEQLKDIQMVIDNLIAIVNRKLKGKQEKRK